MCTFLCARENFDNTMKVVVNVIWLWTSSRVTVLRHSWPLEISDSVGAVGRKEGGLTIEKRIGKLFIQSTRVQNPQRFFENAQRRQAQTHTPKNVRIQILTSNVLMTTKRGDVSVFILFFTYSAISESYTKVHKQSLGMMYLQIRSFSKPGKYGGSNKKG